MEVRYDAKTKTLTIEIQVNAEKVADLPMSASGKNRILASSGGNQAFAVTPFGQIKVGVNAFLK